MKFDTVIIGGGLSGLACGIRLAEEGQKCAIVSSGQSAIHFFSGSFDLLGYADGKEVVHPLATIPGLPAGHPYHRIGVDHIPRLAEQAQALLLRAGLNFHGGADRNHFVLTPMGAFKPTWLTLDDFTGFEERSTGPWKKAVVINFNGFLDFPALFIKDGLERNGVEVRIDTIAMEQLEPVRRNPSEMRSANIAKVLDRREAIDECARQVNILGRDVDVVVLPAVFGLFAPEASTRLRELVEKPLVLLPALPPSVPGIRSQIMLRQRFQLLGGTYFLGDRVEGGTFTADRLAAVSTSNHGDILLEADNFVLASGSFYSKGIVADQHALHEPIFDLDIEGDADRRCWFDSRVFNDQPFMHYGVKTDGNLCGMRDGQVIDNLYVAGSVLGGANPLKEGSGAGICLLSSLRIAERILVSQA